MAGWLSSKLKVAEQILQQIDQQAAESFGKPENQKSNGLANNTKEISRTFISRNTQSSESAFGKPKEIFGHTLQVATQEDSSHTSLGIRKPVTDAYGQKGIGSVPRSQLRNQHARGPSQPVLMDGSMDESNASSKEDWTQLLASPDFRGASSAVRPSNVGSSDFGGTLAFRGVSSKPSLHGGQSGAHLPSAGSASRSSSVHILSKPVPSQSSQSRSCTKAIPFDGLMSFENATVHKISRPENLRQHLEQGGNHSEKPELELKEQFVEDTVSTTQNKGLEHKCESSIPDMSDMLPLARGKPIFASANKLSSGIEKVGNANGILEGCKHAVEHIVPAETVGMHEHLGRLEVENRIDGLQGTEKRECLQPDASLDVVAVSVESSSKLDDTCSQACKESDLVGQITLAKEENEDPVATLKVSPHMENKDIELVKSSSKPTAEQLEDVNQGRQKLVEIGENLSTSIKVKDLAAESGQMGGLIESGTQENAASLSESELELYGSETESNSDSTSASDSGYEDIEQHKLAQRKWATKRKALAAVAAAAAIKERKDFVEKLEKEKELLERTLAEHENHRAREAAELCTSTMEVIQALELEKQQHSLTRMKALGRESQLENENAVLAKCLAAVQRSLEEQISQVAVSRNFVEDKEITRADLERKISQIRHSLWSSQHIQEADLSSNTALDEVSFMEEQAGLWRMIEQCQIKVKELEQRIGDLKTVQHSPTDAEIELEKRLAQLTDQLIQKQAQVEALSTEKATLVFRLEALSNALQEERSVTLSRALRSGRGNRTSSDWISVDDLEYGFNRSLNSKNKFVLPNSDKVYTFNASASGHPILSLLRQIDALLSAGVFYIQRHRWAQAFALAYLLSLHLWVVFVLFMQSKADKDVDSQALVLPNKTSDLTRVSNITKFL
eukprot:c26168_g1_i1 orf=260-2980(-)